MGAEDRKLELIESFPDEEAIALVRAEFEAFLSGRVPSTALEASFASLYEALLGACGFDEKRAELEFNSLMGVQPDDIPEYPEHLKAVEAS
jgi:hypothetical protein